MTYQLRRSLVAPGAALGLPPGVRPRLELETVWPEALTPALCAVKGDVGPEWYRGAHRAGELLLACYGPPGAVWAWILWRIDESPRELVAVAAVNGPDHPGGTAPGLLEELEALALEEGCELARFHTARPGAISRALAAGWHQSEVIMRKRLLPASGAC